MALMIDSTHPASKRSANFVRRRFYRMLLAILRWRRRPRPQPLPAWLYADLGLPPRHGREIVRRGR